MVKSEDGVKKKSQDLPSFQLQLNKSTPCEYQGQQELSVYLESDPESADQHTNAGVSAFINDFCCEVGEIGTFKMLLRLSCSFV